MTDKTKTAAGVELSKGEIAGAQKDGALNYIKEAAHSTMATDTGTTSYDSAADYDRFRVDPSLNTTFIAPLLDLSSDDLKRRLIEQEAADAIPFDQAKGLLALERAGKNRTGYVKVLCAAIGVDSPFKVTSAGPAYTNDETAVSAL